MEQGQVILTFMDTEKRKIKFFTIVLLTLKKCFIQIQKSSINVTLF